MPNDRTQTVGDDGRDVRIGAIINDFLDRRSRGEPISETLLLSQHPELAAELREALAVLSELRPPADPLQTLIDQGVLTKSGDPRYPAELGPYQIIGFVGRGGMGVVLKAYEESLSRTVALKLLRRELADDAGAIARFSREATAAAALRHPHIVTIHAIGEERGVHFIAMEYVDGTNLAELIRSSAPLPADTTRRIFPAGPRIPSRPDDSAESPPRPLPTDLIRALFRQLLSGLDAAHKCGLIHRDIKSANILLDGPEQRVKIVDFGLARLLSTQTRVTLPDSILGTPEYMSPEQARGDERIDHRTDLYSAGVVLYEMLTARTPFHAETPTATIHRILHDEPEDPRKVGVVVDPPLASLALRLMAKRPEDRFASAAEALAALDAGVPVYRPRSRRHSVRRAALAAILVVALTGAAWWAVPQIVSGRRIRAVELSPDHREVIAYYGDSAQGTVFWRYPREAPKPISGATVAADDRGNRKVVVGLAQPTMIRHTSNAALLAFDERGTLRWEISLTPVPNQIWPNCVRKDAWACSQVVAKDLDGQPGNELVVVGIATSSEYPTRISVIGTRTGTIRWTFWHMGQIAQIQLVDDFFDGERPAIVAWGVNNKLDGFDDDERSGFESRQEGDDLPRTDWDWASVLMILDPDPARLNGLGPPRTRRLHWLVGREAPPARPYAYALLDMPHDVCEGRRRPGSDVRERVEPQNTAMIQNCAVSTGEDVSASGACLSVSVNRGWVRAQGEYGGAQLWLDRHLDITKWIKAPGEPEGKDWWSDHWKVIIREYQYVN